MPYTTYTLTELQTQLADETDLTPFWSSEEARLALNEGLQVYNLLTGFWKRRVVTPTVAGVPWVTIPGTITYALRVEFNEYPLVLDSVAAMDFGRPTWEHETTASGGDVPTRPIHWMPNGLTEIGIWPADAAGSNAIVLDGVAATPQLVAATDTLDLGEEDLRALLGYALHSMAYKLGGARFAATEGLYQQFILAAADRNSRLKASAFFLQQMGRDQQTTLVPVRQPVPPPPGARS